MELACCRPMSSVDMLLDLGCSILHSCKRQDEVGLNDPISCCNYDTLVQTQMAHKNESRLVLVHTMYKRASLGKGEKELSENSIGP